MKEPIIQLIEHTNKILIATVDKAKKPQIRFIDKLVFFEDKYYFIVEKGNPLLKDLKKNPHIVLYFDYDDSKVKLIGEAKILSKDKKKSFIDFKKMELNNSVVDIVKIKNLKQESNHLDKDIPEKEETGHIKTEKSSDSTYHINSKCKTCNKCYKACPYSAIRKGKKQYKIDSNLCVNCGKCYKVCPHNAIDKTKKL